MIPDAGPVDFSIRDSVQQGRPSGISIMAILHYNLPQYIDNDPH